MQERRLSFLLTSTLLTLSLGTWVVTSALVQTVGQAEQAKELVGKSGLYTAVIPSQLADAQKANPVLADLPLDNPEIQKLLAVSLDSKKVQAEGDRAIDGIYGWLEGTSDKPTIDINVAPNQGALAVSAGDYAAKYAATLPACGPGEGEYSPAEFAARPLSATCLPAGTKGEIVKNYVANSIASNPALAVGTQLTEQDVRFSNGKTIMEAFDGAPVWYQRAQTLPLLAAAVAGLCALVLLLILRPLGGIKSTGKHMLTVGITLALVSVVLAWILEMSLGMLLPKNQNPNIAEALTRLTTLFNNALRDNILVLSLYLAAGGAVLLAAAYILKRMHHKPAISSANSMQASSYSASASFSPMATQVAAKSTHRKSSVRKTATRKKKT
jgi:hypothetical protein